MLKRLFTAFLVAVMAMSLCITATAEDMPAGENIFKVWGDFENEEHWDKITVGKIDFNGVGATTTIADIGADGSNHSLKIDTTEATSSVFWLYRPAVPGETYDLSFKIKTDTPGVSSFQIHNVYDDKTYILLKKIDFSSNSGWTEFKATYTVPYENNGKAIYEGTKFQIDAGKCVLYMDNLRMVAHGNVENADHGQANGGIISFEEGDGVEVAKPKTPESDEGAINIYVDAKKGNDRNKGTQEKPLASIEAARDMAKKYAPTMQNNIYIRIRGEQYIEETFTLDETNSGQNGYKIVYTSWGDEKAVLTMAKKYKGFKIHDKDKNIWKIKVGKGTYSRTAYFDEVLGIRARTVGYLENVEYISKSHYLCDNTELLKTAYPKEIEFVYHCYWYMVVHTPKKIYKEDGRIRIDMNDYFYTSYNRLDYYAASAGLKRQTPSYLENAYEFLDMPGEWYLNKHNGYLYYIPRQGEDVKNLELKLPIGEEMMKVKGSSNLKPVSHIAFDNITFDGTTWLRVEQLGGAEFVQNNKLHDNTAQSAPGFPDKTSILFDGCRYVDITDCTFRHLGSAGPSVEFYRASKYVNVIGNEFYELGGGGIEFDYPISSTPYNRSAASLCEYITIENNYFHDISLDFMGCAAISLGHPRHTKIRYNEISNTTYSGIHSGWGWEKIADTGTPMYDVEISYNYIHDIMMDRLNDGAHIYNVGPSSHECDTTPDAPNNGANKNKMINNYLVNGWNCSQIYPDMGSTSWYVANNVCDDGYVDEIQYNFDEGHIPRSTYYWMHLHHSSIMWITTENNYAQSDYAYVKKQMNQQESSIEPTKFIVTGEEWPQEAYDIIAGAGIQKEYKERFNLTGPKHFGSPNRWQSLALETPTDSELMVIGDYNKQYDLSDYKIYWWIDDPEAVTIDENGMLTAHKKGVFEAEAFIFLDGRWQSEHFLLECGDEIEKISVGYASVNMAEGQSIEVSVQAEMTFGQVIDITNEAEIKVKSDDESVAVIEKSEDGKKYVISAIGKGETTISGTADYNGKVYAISIPVRIITYASEEGAKLPFAQVDFSKGWSSAGTETADGGLKVFGYGNTTTKKYTGLIGFDLVIMPGHSWPAISVSDKDFSVPYSNSSQYMIGFRETHLEVQRFNEGIRTMIFGNSYNPVAGLGISNKDNELYEYGKRMSVVMGTLDTPEGTRIIVNINGKNILDYIDKDEKAITAEGHIEVNNPATNGGGMIFYPYTGITE